MQEELLQLKTIEKSLAVFCLATYGEGDPTDNAMEFWEWIAGDVDLAGLNYAVSITLEILYICNENKLKCHNMVEGGVMTFVLFVYCVNIFTSEAVKDNVENFLRNKSCLFRAKIK